MESSTANSVPRWKDRLAALRNTLPIFQMVWEASPAIVVANIGVRLVVSLLPLAMLAVTKAIIDEHGGTILVRSTPGVGSRFTIRLPL